MGKENVRKYVFSSVMRESIVQIVYCIDNLEDVKIVTVSIQSILEHASDNHFYDIYLVTKTQVPLEKQDNIDFLPKNFRVTWINYSVENIKKGL